MIKVYYLSRITRSTRLRINLRSMKIRTHQIVKKSEIAKKASAHSTDDEHFSEERYCIFRRSTATYWFSYLKMTRWFEGGALSITGHRILCFPFSKERDGAYFCPTYKIEGGALSSIYGLDNIWRFYYICGQFVFHLRALIHLWSICITFEDINTFVVNFYHIWGVYYICGQLLRFAFNRR